MMDDLFNWLTRPLANSHRRFKCKSDSIANWNQLADYGTIASVTCRNGILQFSSVHYIMRLFRISFRLANVIQRLLVDSLLLLENTWCYFSTQCELLLDNQYFWTFSMNYHDASSDDWYCNRFWCPTSLANDHSQNLLRNARFSMKLVF